MLQLAAVLVLVGAIGLVLSLGSFFLLIQAKLDSEIAIMKKVHHPNCIEFYESELPSLIVGISQCRVFALPCLHCDSAM